MTKWSYRGLHCWLLRVFALCNSVVDVLVEDTNACTAHLRYPMAKWNAPGAPSQDNSNWKKHTFTNKNSFGCNLNSLLTTWFDFTNYHIWPQWSQHKNMNNRNGNSNHPVHHKEHTPARESLKNCSSFNCLYFWFWQRMFSNGRTKWKIFQAKES